MMRLLGIGFAISIGAIFQLIPVFRQRMGQTLQSDKLICRISDSKAIQLLLELLRGDFVDRNLTAWWWWD
jgi:hypothetical protein